MKNLQKIFLVCFLIGGMLTSALITQGQASKSKIKGVDYLPQAYLSAGEDASLCNDSKFKTQGVWQNLKDCGGKIIWKTSGDGKFGNPFSLHTIYTPGQQDIKEGQVMLTLIYVSYGELSTILQKDSMVLYLSNCASGNVGSEH
ncbi:hypothetical protein N9934_02505 [Desulfosarcina sp.]|nr:hypothetical protein [Desulfosarcina sp.]